MEMFSVREGQLVLSTNTTDPNAIPYLTTADCLIYKYDMAVGSQFIHPGTIISQQNGIVHGHTINGIEVFAHPCQKRLEHFKIDDGRLFALDSEGNAHIFKRKPMSSKTVVLSTRPLGWYIVPQTDFIVMWNILSLYVVDITEKTTTMLSGHTKRVMCADGNKSTVITGDQAGHVRIWYICSWQCFHDIDTGPNPIVQIVANEMQAGIRKENKIIVLDIVTGRVIEEKRVQANALCFTKNRLVVAQNGMIEISMDGTIMANIQHPASRLLASVDGTFWAIAHREITELEISERATTWQQECLDWVKNPIFPFDKNWPSKRYMDVLAICTDEWMLASKSLPPTSWFQHPALRDAILDTCLRKKLRISFAWPKLSFTILEMWYTKCHAYILEHVKRFEWDPFIVHLLEEHMQEKPIKDPTIRKWCWFHHGRLAMRPVLMHISDNDADGEFLETILDETSPDAILCVSDFAIRHWLDLGYIAVFIRWLQNFHNFYSVGPIEHLSSIFKLIVQQCFRIRPETMDIPLDECGTWAQKTRLMPNDKGAFVKKNSRKGFVTSVTIQTNGVRKCKWNPIHREREVDLIGTVHVWTPKFKRGPNTYIECALELLQASQWSCEGHRKPWKWFASELGAFINTGLNIFLLDKHMRIRKAKWTERGGIIVSTGNATIEEYEHGPLECETDPWSYIDQNICYLATLRLKICSLLPLSHRKNIVPIEYASDILNCCISKPMEHELTWPSKNQITCMTSCSRHFIVGFSNGSIHEYANVTAFDRQVRSFDSHETEIRALYIIQNQLLSLTHRKICIFSLTSGTLQMEIKSRFLFEHAVPVNANRVWTVETSFRTVDSQPIVTLWDTEQQIPLRTLETPIIEYPTRDMVTCNDELIMAFESTIIAWVDNEHRVFDLAHDEKVSCLIKKDTSLYGGTHDGTLFSIDTESGTPSEKTYNTPYNDEITTIAHIPESDYFIVGTDTGHVILWNVKDETTFVTRRLTPGRIVHIHVENILVFVSFGRSLVCLNIVPGRCVLSCQALLHIMDWSFPWRSRVMKNVEQIVIPSVLHCLRSQTACRLAIDIAEQCTAEYNDRLAWCVPKVFDAFMSIKPCLAKTILHRLVTFRGPRLMCMICNDDQLDKHISFIKPCNHRFHTSCLKELIQKQPEYNEEMQYEYALTFCLQCPTCREPFQPEDVYPDTFLNDSLLKCT